MDYGGSMKLYLKEIDESNWIECVFLTTNQDQQHFVREEFVASNALSIAQSKIEKEWITKAIYVDEVMVGFTMYGFNVEHNFYEICRLMIDYRYQGKGYGRLALQRVIDEMIAIDGCYEIYLSFDPNNIIGKFLYESFNFIDTGKIVDGEVLYSYQVIK